MKLGLKQVLIERVLWPANNGRSDGFAFLARCPATGGRLGYDSSVPGGCCARAVMANEPDFRNQKGRVEEELESRDQLLILSKISLRAEHHRQLLVLV